MEKYDYKKNEKDIYTSNKNPHLITINSGNYFTLEGIGNPNEENFSKNIEVLYNLSYAVKMSYKKPYKPNDYYEYTVFPLEGFWDISDDAKIRGTFTKADLVYKLMIKQPSFVTPEFSEFIKQKVLESKKNPLINTVNFEEISEGLCIQMLHIGSYDDEPKSFVLMEEFAKNNGMKRVSKTHKEIYLSDARKVEASKLKTILRFKVEKNI